MNPAAVTDLARRGAALGTLVQGLTLIYRGNPVRVRVSQGAPELDLGSGGYSQKQVWKLRFSATLPVPELREKLTDPRTGRVYVVKGVAPASDAATSGEHLVEATFQ